MDLTYNLKYGFKLVKKFWWLIFVPTLLDFTPLLISENLLEMNYNPSLNKLFVVKFGTISAPPSISYILEDFPKLFLNLNINVGLSRLISSINLYNIFLILSFILITSFLLSGYLACIEKCNLEKITFKDFFILGNKYWIKFFILSVINQLVIILVYIHIGFIIVLFLLSILYYVKYSIVVDNCSLIGSFKNGINIFIENLGTTIKLALYYGFIFSFISLFIFQLIKTGNIGVILSIIIVNFFGMAINASVLQIYRELSFNSLSSTP
ncbi:hypothetical protein [Clostridium sp. JNZ J1-5]